MNLRDRIQSLHHGQVAILVAVIAGVAAGLWSLIHAVDRKQTAAETRISQFGAELDSLDTQTKLCGDTTVQLVDSLARAFNRAMLEGRMPSSGGFIKAVAGDCSGIPARTSALQWLRAEAVAGRDRGRKEIVVLEVFAVLCIGVALSLLWVWFEGRRHGATSTRSAMASLRRSSQESSLRRSVKFGCPLDAC